ncbi:hypothetical protein [uncultured Methanobrevibacter sp.]|uniref:hypothetical protein n=1 Tax=uncultured Methanobrevibacter sp. TaxID=253161 RepID=UPI0025CE1564|nr:hypothetical protein [uncultured Methanobrevibacter sp.]
MDSKKKIIIVAVFIIAVVFIVSFALGAFSTGPTTKFNNDFMSGSIVGNAIEQPQTNNSNYSKWAQSYKDKTNGIEYNMSTCDNASFLLDVMQIQGGLPDPEIRKINGLNWTIYYSQAVPTTEVNSNNPVNNTDPTLDVYILSTTYNNQSYLVYVVSNRTVECDGTTYCKLYKEHIVPYLESVHLKHSSNVPHIYDLLGISSSDYKQLVDYVAQYKAGNLTEESAAEASG